MAKTSTRTKSLRGNWGLSVRGRDAEFPSAPIRVSEDAQPKRSGGNATRQFDFGRRDRNTLPERPSTSGGATANLSMRKNAERRETKDDLHFNPLAAHGKETTFYNFPLPGTVPTPAHTPKSSPPLPRKSTTTRSYTPDSMEAKPAFLNVEQAEIGMALGSPTHQPTSWQSQSGHDLNARSPSPDMQPSMDGYSDPPIPLKQKASKWKTLGGLFGGKKQNNPQTFYQLQPEVTHHTTMDEDYIDFGEPPLTSEKKPSKSRGRRRTNSEKKMGKQRPDVQRANTAPLRFDLKVDGARSQTTTPEITIDGPIMDTATQLHHHQISPLLHVDIPSTHMERYSIMFGSVLQKPASSFTSSSLLARRQATLDKLKTVNEALASKERELEERAKQLRPRRATSPQPTKSPAFSLFPQTPSRLTVRDASPSPPGHRGSSLQRSNTSPAALSPARPSFAPQLDNEMHATLVGPAPHIPINPHPKDKSVNQGKRNGKGLKVSAKQSTALAPPQPVEHNWSPEESHLALDSPVSDIEPSDADTYDGAPFLMKPKLDEPAWQMITHRNQKAPSSLSGSISSRSDGHSTSTSASSISTSSIPHNTTPKHVQIQAPPATRRNRRPATSSSIRTGPSEVSNIAYSNPIVSIPRSTAMPRPAAKLPTNEDNEREERLKSAADISIARQISVSRQQRQLLIPIKKSSSSSLKNPNPNFPSPSPLNITRVASPLGVVAAAAESPVAGKGGSPLVRRGTAERLVAASANTSTPTLVVVGASKGEAEKAWAGATVGKDAAVLGMAKEEIREGLAIGSPLGSGNRKSERVVIEGIATQKFSLS